jgi:hypothetical protein
MRPVVSPRWLYSNSSTVSDDDLIVSGGGSIVVAPDEVLARIEKISHLGEHLRSASHELHGLVVAAEQPSNTLAGWAAARDADRQLQLAMGLATIASRRATTLYHALRQCLHVYAQTENAVRHEVRSVGGALAWMLGAITPIVIAPLAVGLFADEGLLQAVTHLSPKQQARAARTYLREHPGILNNPTAVKLLREVVMSTDDYGDGLIGMPQPLANLLGDQGLGVLGVPSSAATVALMGGTFGLLRESGVTVRRTGTILPVAPPTSIEERAQRIPEVTAGGNQSQIRIDRYVSPGKPDSFDVYIGGTVTFDPKQGTQPFDFTSDISGVAEESPGSYRAVLQAMKAAGVTRESPVVLNGYSQGGLIASLVAKSGKFDVHGVVTFGAPSGQVPVPAGVPVLELRHTEDIVPATGGDDVSDSAVIVQRSVFAHQSIPTGFAVPAHRLSFYEQTAGIVDHAKSSELKGIVGEIDGFGAGTTNGTSTAWRAVRVSPATSATGP